MADTSAFVVDLTAFNAAKQAAKARRPRIADDKEARRIAQQGGKGDPEKPWH